ncbi:MAG: NADP-binding protein [Deltaproteobacteria bacterium]|jgi:4-hydroxy-tetrahydrodipicolinate reductase|nr:NADP-binding protein [Deltaproteobacteria bacterium]
MKENVKVILWGLGAMGGGMGLDLLQNRKGVEIVGAIGSNPSKFNLDLGEVLEAGREIGIKVSGNAEAVLQTRADIVLHSTDSFAKNVLPQLEKVVASGKNVITTAEELAALEAGEPGLARELDALAKQHGVTVLGTGINPGFVLDTLVVALSGACQVVNKIRAARINDLSPFGPTVMRTQGVGSSLEEFRKGVADGSIVGHIGFKESIYMIARSLGWKLERIEETREPIITEVPRETPHVKVKAGDVAGCRHIARGFVDGRETITLEHPQQIHPHLGKVKTGDYITIEGLPGMKWSDEKEIPGGISTMAVVVNMIPQVINAEPGLKTMLDLPVASAIMGDMREKIKQR